MILMAAVLFAQLSVPVAPIEGDCFYYDGVSARKIECPASTLTVDRLRITGGGLPTLTLTAPTMGQLLPKPGQCLLAEDIQVGKLRWVRCKVLP